MKKGLFDLMRISFLFLIIISFIGCITVEQTIYLGDVEVNAPIVPPPTHIDVNKEVGEMSISPRFSIFTSNNKIIGSTDGRYSGTFKINDSISYRSNRQNLEWEPYNFTAGADMDLKISKVVSVFGGINVSGRNNKTLMGGNFGLGFHNHNEMHIARLDLGLTIQEYDFTAVTIVHTKTTFAWGDESEYWDIFADKGSSTNINPFMTLTVNSSYDSSLINWFIAGGYFTQNLLGYKPGSYSTPLLFPLPIGTYTKIDKRSDMVAGFIYFNPGIILNLNEKIRALISAKILNEVNSSATKQWYFAPSLQIDFQL